MNEGKLEIIIVAGVTGSGKSTFSRCFKNSFLRSLPLLSLADGIQKKESFFFETNLTNRSQLEYLADAKKVGYEIHAYYLFTGKLLSMYRAYLREMATRETFDESLFRRTYESSYKGLVSLYQVADLVFFIRNQGLFEFLSAFQPSKITLSEYVSSVKQVKASVDRIH
jgi:predicted ABC-type ATPase